MKIGTFAVVSIMVGKSVTMFSDISSPIEALRNATAGQSEHWVLETKSYTSTQVAITLCFLVGVIQVRTLYVNIFMYYF